MYNVQKGSLAFSAIATISDVHVDREAPEYRRMTLNIRTEASADLILCAVYESDQPPALNTSYDVFGEMFFSIGPGSTFTYVLVQSLSIVSSGPPEVPKLPQFEIIGTVTSLEDCVATVVYRVFDEYQHGTYTQYVKVCYGEEQASRFATGMTLVARGRMHDLHKLVLHQIARPVNIAMPA